MRFGQGKYQYELVEGWGKLPAHVAFSQVAAIAVDSKDNVYAYHRGMHPVIVFDRGGKMIGAWGDGFLAEAHGMFIDRDDNLFLVDRGGHTIEKCAGDGKKLMTVGSKYQCAPKFSDKPFNLPQGVATSPVDGAIYVADGKNNNAVHKYTADGKYVKSWGKQGTGPGEFNEPHGMWVQKDGTVMCADRGNNRIQFFTPDGQYIKEWGEKVIHHPDHIYINPDGDIFITEIELHRISILTPDGELISRWGVQGKGLGPTGHPVGVSDPGYFNGPHGVWCDSRGDLYISEVLRGKRVQKFARV